MWSVAKSHRLYGETISPGTLAYMRRCQTLLLSIAVIGTIVQIIQVPGPPALEYVAAFIYLAYNITTMVIIRISNIAFKFEDATSLWILVRTATAMALYGVIVAATVPTFQTRGAQALVGIFGLVNVIVILPTNIYEDSMMLKARSDGVGLDKAQPLGCCENLVVVGFLVLGNAIVLLMIVTNIAILAGPNAWGPLVGIYLAFNLVPIVLPKVEHLVSTEKRTWPLKILLLHFALVLLAVILTFITLGTQNPPRNIRILFGVIGTINGIIVAIVLVLTALGGIYAPRTGADLPPAKHLQLEPAEQKTNQAEEP